MNRREFFKAASVAPVAVPMAVQAAAAADPFLIKMSMRVQDGEWVEIPRTLILRRRLLRERQRIIWHTDHAELYGRVTGYDAETGKLEMTVDPDPSVEAQMREHDLFDWEPAPASL